VVRIKLRIRFLYVGGKDVSRIRLRISFLYVGGRKWLGLNLG